MPEDLEGVPETGYYVYGVVPVSGGSSLSVPLSLQGIDQAAVELVAYHDVAAATSVMLLDRPPGRRAELMAHTAVVDALAAAGPVLPVKFGSVLESRDSVVHDLLAPDHDRYVDLLANLAGCHQFNLRATYVEEQVLGEIVRAHPEIARLRRRTRDLPEGALHPDLVRLGELVSRALEDARAEDASVVMEAVQDFVLDEAPRPGGGPDHLLEMALLVEDERVPELEEALEVLAEALHERIRLRLAGPLAPYDFAEAG